MADYQSTTTHYTAADWQRLKQRLTAWAKELGFDRVGIGKIDLAEDEARLQEWLARGWHGEMEYMQRHGGKRSRPARLRPGTLRVISALRHYYPRAAEDSRSVLATRDMAFVSRYALGRDYHKLMRRGLQKLARRIEAEIGSFGYRVFSDSAPVMEKPLARNAGFGWIGKHTNLIDPTAGSWFFLGEILTDLPLPADAGFQSNHCGSCRACLDICPTNAIVAPYQLDARRCISYLTIELRGTIPVDLRPLIGNRIFGCDDCQLVCPWNRFAQLADDPDFAPRHNLDSARLLDLFTWSETEFLERTQGNAIRRTGYEGWLRNIAVALGNGPASRAVIRALREQAHHPSPVVREHIDWALQRLREARADQEQHLP